MNNKKNIIILCITLGILILGILAYIISSNIVKNDSKVQNINTDNSINTNKIENDTQNINTDGTHSEEKYENVVLTSRIGNEVLSKFCISNIFSTAVYNEIEKSGLSDSAKLIYTYVTIISNYYYHNMIKNSEEFGDYISKEDFEIVYKDLFGKNSVVNHKSIITDTLYNEEKGYYEYLTLGYGGIEFDFIVEVPYQIKEYKDRVEALFYRIYCKATSSLNEDGEVEQLVYLYSDDSRTNVIYSSDDVRLQDNDSQQEFITKLIQAGNINKETLENITYILKEDDDTYYISDIEK